MNSSNDEPIFRGDQESDSEDSETVAANNNDETETDTVAANNLELQDVVLSKEVLNTKYDSLYSLTNVKKKIVEILKKLSVTE